MNTANGVTTAVGLLGTDALTRSAESLYAKTQSFSAESLTAFMLTGSYWHPSPTITERAVVDATCMNSLPAEGSVHMSAADFACLADDRGLFDRASFSSSVGGSGSQSDLKGTISV
jgi:beta-aspartyl-dipeptidase (metallo-type)